MLTRLRDGILLCRPRQWVKNVFVLAPLIFSGTVFISTARFHAFLAFAAFCTTSSAVYVFNDLIDREADRLHPRKCKRPLAAGRVSVIEAIGLCALLLVSGLTIGLPLSKSFLFFIGLYLANSLLYCLVLKHQVILDVMSIAVGFVLRLLAGCAAVEVKPSSWILVCGFSLALALGFGKRRTELAQPKTATQVRIALTNYDAAKLDTLLAISTAITLLAYMLYTIAPETVELHKTQNLLFSVPLVAYGLFRYLFKVQEGSGDGPTEILLGDRAFLILGIIWIITICVILYWP